ncbi:hypothetical protein GBF38_001750 [Nibea albiflora]|uniref:Uncharacterized protein n=1 Tax=Nibea albiflora TaxID=240163 RepID=A0ACB7EUQ5_NIBAL|nr:hypothetical protein GBF38_001750 [Nibea albiflora]
MPAQRPRELIAHARHNVSTEASLLSCSWWGVKLHGKQTKKNIAAETSQCSSWWDPQPRLGKWSEEEEEEGGGEGSGDMEVEDENEKREGGGRQFTTFLNTVSTYIKKWFNCSEDNWLFHLQRLSLTSRRVSYDGMKKFTEWFRLVGRLNVFVDELYVGCVPANSLTEHQGWVSRGTAERWMAALQAADLPNILATVSFVLSIPFSTGFNEK